MATYVIVEMTVTEYGKACEIRDRAAKTRMLLVEGAT